MKCYQLLFGHSLSVCLEFVRVTALNLDFCDEPDPECLFDHKVAP